MTVDSGNLQIIFLFLDLPLGEQWIEMLCGEGAKKSSLCDSDSAQTPQKETCTRDSWEGSTQGSVCCSSTESRWMLRLCQLHVLWQHIKEEPGSLACEPCSVCPLPARNQTWHALLNKEFLRLRLWLQAASLKSISRQWKQWRTSVGEWEAVCVCEVLRQASWGCVCVGSGWGMLGPHQWPHWVDPLVQTRGNPDRLWQECESRISLEAWELQLRPQMRSRQQQKTDKLTQTHAHWERH